MPYEVTRRFEAALCEYTGAPFAVALNSGTAALLLCLSRFSPTQVEIPRRTYVSVPMSIKLAGHNIAWRDENWTGAYELKIWGGQNRTPKLWDCARRFTSNMYVPGQFQCVSFAASKILGAEQGGAILHDDAGADAWFRRMRFDGRTEGVDPLEDTFDLVGHHCLMIPSVAATLLVRLYHLPKHNDDLPHYEYPDLSTHKAFK